MPSPWLDFVVRDVRLGARMLRDAGRGRVDLLAMSYPNKPRVTFDGASGERETVRAQFVTGITFERLGVGAALGRLLTIQDDDRSAPHRWPS